MSSPEDQKQDATPHFEEDFEDGDRALAMMLSSASVLPMVLKAATELGVLEIMEKAGPDALLSPSQIASRLHSNNPDAPLLLDRMLRLLASYCIVNCSNNNNDDNNDNGQVTRLYGLEPLAKYFIPNQDGVSLAPMLQAIQDKVMVDMWHHLKDAVMEGGLPFNRAHGMSSSEYVGTDARYYEIFKSSVGNYNPLFMKRILEIYNGFEGLSSLVDVGGGDGSILNMIVSKYPAIKGINFDLAPVVEMAPSYLGIENVAGDVFVSIPKGDAIFMKWILHTWDDKHCLQLLRNCYESIPEQGKVMVVDLVAPEIPHTNVAGRSELQLDLFMMNMNPGGKERTQREFESLAKAAGFAGARVACTTYSFSVVEFYKKV